VNLAGRYFAVLSGFAAAGFTAFALVDAVPAFNENLEMASARQQDEARMAGNRIETRLDVLERQIAAVAELPWHEGVLGDDDEREEYRRLMSLNPAIHEMRTLDEDKSVRVFVSRVSLDGPASAPALPTAIPALRGRSAWYGDTYFRNASKPFVTLAIGGRERARQTTVAELDLKFVSDIVDRAGFGKSGRVYVVDRSNHLLAHPESRLVHRKLDLSVYPQVRAARARLERTEGRTVSVEGTSLDGDERVYASAFEIPRAGWLVLAEQPRDEVLAPVMDSLYRTLGLLALILLLAFAVSVVIARTLTRPILEIQRGATRLGRGDLQARVNVVATGDEIEMLGNEFNRMAANLGHSYSELEQRVVARTEALAKAGEALQHQAREVEALNEQLTAQLTELARSKEEAERANAAKSRFLAAASHDLRQPMHTVSLLVGILRERLLGRDGLDLVDKVQASVHSMERLFNSLLDISRLDADAVRPNVSQFPLQALFDEITANYALQAREKGLDFRVVPTRAIMRSDLALLERSIGNLVANAIRYTERGGILVGVRRRRVGRSIVVYDTGVGIAREHLDDIFEEFFQIDSRNAEQAQGLGLGLSIVKRTAVLLHLPLRVSSRPGRGSVFEIGVPVVADAEAPQRGVPSDFTRTIDGAFVVVIDDEAENRYATEALCRQWGCHVVSGASAREALAELAKHLRAPDLIVTDFRLRDGLTGLMAIDDIRCQADACIPAIVVSGDVAVQDVDRDDVVVLRKPLDPAQLRATMSRVLAHA
jgi:signal transduction histidine kinase/CheY-like chemotaxis protein